VRSGRKAEKSVRGKDDCRRAAFLGKSIKNSGEVNMRHTAAPKYVIGKKNGVTGKQRPCLKQMAKKVDLDLRKITPRRPGGEQNSLSEKKGREKKGKTISPLNGEGKT